MKNRNDLGELNDILFARLRALDDPDLKGEDLDAEIRKTDAVIDVSQSIILRATWYSRPPGARKMTYKHRWLWEQAHGPIPADHVLVFLDGDKTNCNLDNLILLPRGVHARMCQRHLYSNDPEKTKSGILLAKLLSKRYARKKYKQWDNQRNWRRKP